MEEMKLLLIRHGKTYDRPDWQKANKDKPDSERPMTPKGKEEFAVFAQCLKATIDHIDIIWSSPMVRTMQTAELLAKTYPKTKVEQQSVLLHDSKWSSLEELMLEDYKNKRVLALVGHDSHLTYLSSKLMGFSKKDEILEFKKGACAIFEVEKHKKELRGKLEAFIQPSFLLNLGVC
jgi:phosphohistidine phosphatase